MCGEVGVGGWVGVHKHKGGTSEWGAHKPLLLSGSMVIAS